MANAALVMGLGRSGVAAAALLQSRCYQTTIIDEGSGSAGVAMRSRLQQLGVHIFERQTELPVGRFATVVVSPGISCDHPWVVEALSRCHDVISELELGYRYCECPILAVTGTNGKSTLVYLLNQMLGRCGARSMAGGNLGTPLCDLVPASRRLDWLVVEVSSFQLELVRHFRPHGAVLLNVQPDHLDRHHDMQTYFKLKCRLFARMGRDTVGVVLQELLPAVQECMRGGAVPKWVPFGGDMRTWRYDAATHRISGLLSDQHTPVSLSVRHSYFDNAVTGQTAAAAVALLSACVPIEPEWVETALQSFCSLPHRVAFVGEVGGIRFVDDSKATNIAAMCAALSMQKRPVHLIAGGILKEKDAFVAKQVLKKHVSCVYVIGEAAEYLAQSWGSDVTVIRCGTLENAVQTVWERARSGEVVLLSPGCASFDQFRSYAERGERFAHLVAAQKQESTRSGE